MLFLAFSMLNMAAQNLPFPYIFQIAIDEFNIQKLIDENNPKNTQRGALDALLKIWKMSSEDQKNKILIFIDDQSHLRFEFLRMVLPLPDGRYIYLEILKRILNENTHESLDLLIDLLTDNRLAGREGEKINEIALLYLQEKVIFIYPYKHNKFLKNIGYQIKTKNRYKKWCSTNKFVFSEDLRMFMSEYQTPDLIKKHENWLSSIRNQYIGE